MNSKTLLILVVLGAVGFGAWWFFFRRPRGAPVSVGGSVSMQAQGLSTEDMLKPPPATAPIIRAAPSYGPPATTQPLPLPASAPKVVTSAPASGTGGLRASPVNQLVSSVKDFASGNITSAVTKSTMVGVNAGIAPIRATGTALWDAGIKTPLDVTKTLFSDPKKALVMSVTAPINTAKNFVSAINPFSW